MKRPAISALKQATGVALTGTIFLAVGQVTLGSGGGSWIPAWITVIVGCACFFVYARRAEERQTRLESQLAAERHQLQALQSAFEDQAFFVLDGDARVTTWSPAAARVTGWTAEAAAGSPFERVFRSSDAANSEIAQMVDTARSNGTARLETECKRRGNGAYPARLRLHTLRRSDGTVTGFTGVVEDQAEILRATSALTDSERLFRAIFEHAAIGIAQVGPDGRMRRVNAHFCSILGQTERDLQNSSFVDFTHPEDLEADLNLVARCLAGEIERYSLEKRYVRPGGEPVWVNLFVALVRDPHNQPAYFVVVAMDISWRKAVEEALADSRQRLQSAIEIARLGFWEFNLDGKTMFYSHEAVAQLGLSEAEVSPNPDEYRSRVHPDDRARLESMRQSMLSGSVESAEGEYRFRHKDGSYRDIHIRTVLVRSGDGRPRRLLGTNIDVTPTRDSERLVRRLSARILRLQDTERRRIARQLHETTAQNLAALNMNLARLGRMVDKPNHDPRPTIDECTSLTEACVQEVRTLAYLLHPPLLDAFGLERAVSDYVQGFARRSAIPTDVEVRGRIERLSDEIELIVFRILQESLTNVVRHSACTHAGVQLEQTESTIELEVSDNGRGISPEKLERLRAGAPLGVGVTGMSERLEQIGGRLEIRSSPAGTIVRAVVPIAHREQTTPAKPQDSAITPVPTAPPVLRENS